MNCSYNWKKEEDSKVGDMEKRETMMNAYAPPDVVREILLRLPCKSLCRFRCVSKQWCSCINDDRFMEEHRKQNMKASHILSWDIVFSTKLQLFSMSMDSYTHIRTITTYKYDRALPSLYGMVCLYGWKNKEIALFNPSSEEIIPLPNLLEPSSYSLGFDFDSKSKRYKIVQLIVEDEAIRRFHIMTVTRNGSSWRSVHVVKASKIRVKSFVNEPICVDGEVYWDTWDTDTGTKFIVFDLSTEEMHVIKTPALGRWMRNVHPYSGRLSMLEGKLCCFDMNLNLNDCTSLTMNTWKFDNHIGWTAGYQFEIFGPVLLLLNLIPLHFYDNKTILFLEKSYSVNVQSVYIYHTEDQTLKSYPMANEEGVSYSLDLFVHFEAMNHSLD